MLARRMLSGAGERRSAAMGRRRLLWILITLLNPASLHAQGPIASPCALRLSTPSHARTIPGEPWCGVQANRHRPWIYQLPSQALCSSPQGGSLLLLGTRNPAITRSLR